MCKKGRNWISKLVKYNKHRSIMLYHIYVPTPRNISVTRRKIDLNRSLRVASSPCSLQFIQYPKKLDIYILIQLDISYTNGTRTQYMLHIYDFPSAKYFSSGYILYTCK